MVDMEAIAASLNVLLTTYGVTRDQLADLLGGAADGGPSHDGNYPVTLASGVTVLVPCPRRLAALSGDVGSAVAAIQPILDAANVAKDGAVTAAGSAVGARDAILNNDGFIAVSTDILLGANSKISKVAGGIVGVNTVAADLALGGPASFILRAPAAALKAQDWAEGMGAPGGPNSRSSKSWASEAERIADAAQQSLAGFQAVADRVSAAPVAGYAGGLRDRLGRFFAVIGLDGVVRFGKARFGSLSATMLSVPGSTTMGAAPPGFLQVWRDPLGRVISGFKLSGELAVGRLVSVRSINNVPIASLLTPKIASTSRPIFGAELNIWIFYGQSIDAGTDSTPVFTVAAINDSYRFAEGVRVYDSASPTRTTLVPLTETIKGPLGETPASAMDASIKQGLSQRYGITPASRTYRMLMTCQARGGTPSEYLAVGTQPYNDMKSDITAGRVAARGLGLASEFIGFNWYNGESDMQDNVPAAAHIGRVKGIREGLDAHAKSLNPANRDVICMISQVWDHSVYGHSNDPYLALAQLALAREDPAHYIMAGHFAHVPLSSFPHSSNVGTQWRACYYGRVYQRVVIEKGTWDHFAPVAATRDGNIVLVRFKPESGKLTWDTTTVSNQPNKGFTLATEAGADIAIVSVDLLGDDTVKIVAASAIPANASVRTGFANGLTNLRDTMGNTEQRTIQGRTYILHNWCLITSTTLA